MRGFSLIETILYIGLFSFFMTALFGSFFMLLDSHRKDTSRADLALNSSFIDARVRQLVYNDRSNSITISSVGTSAIFVDANSLHHTLSCTNSDITIDGISLLDNAIGVSRCAAFHLQSTDFTFSFTLSERGEDGSLHSWNTTTTASLAL